MRLFKPKTIPGWILLAFILCWNLFGIWARIEFIFKNLWPERSMMPFLTAIASSPWFSVVLIIVGLAWIWCTTRPKEVGFIPLSEAVEKLRKEALRQIPLGYSFDSNMEMLIPDEVFDRLARLLAAKIDVYGRQPSSSGSNWVKINDYVFNSDFKRLASELHLKNHYKRGAEFIELRIEKNVLDRAIKEIVSQYKLYQD